MLRTVHDLKREDERRARRDTVNRILTILKAALNSAVEDRRVPVTNAFAWREVKPFAKTDKARTRILTLAEQRSILKNCDEDFARLVRGGLYCGARYGELTQTLVRYYDKVGRKLYIPPEIAKNGKPRHIELDREAKKFFDGIAADREPDEPLFLRRGLQWEKANRHAQWRKRARAPASNPNRSTPCDIPAQHAG